MLTYCLGCKKHTYNVCPKNLVMVTNKKLKEYQNVPIVWQLNRFLIKYSTKGSLRLSCLNFKSNESYKTKHANLLCKV